MNGGPEMYCVVGTDAGGTLVKANELWIQGLDMPFVDRASNYGVTDPYWSRTPGGLRGRNDDPYPDLYVTNVFPREGRVPSPNRLFINEGGRSFRAAPEFGLDQEVGGTGRICVQAVDFDRDGWQDLLVCAKKSRPLYREQRRGRHSRTWAPTWASSRPWLDAELADLRR